MVYVSRRLGPCFARVLLALAMLAPLAGKASALDANLTKALEVAARHSGFPAAPPPRFESLVQVMSAPAAPRVRVSRLVQAGHPYAVYLLEPDEPGGDRYYALYGLGGLAMTGFIGVTRWSVATFSRAHGTISELATGDTASVSIDDAGIRNDYRIHVVGRRERVPGFEWLDDNLVVLQNRLTFNGDTQQQYILYSPRLGAPVYIAHAGVPVYRVAGAQLQGRQLGLTAAQARAQANALLTPVPSASAAPAAAGPSKVPVPSAEPPAAARALASAPGPLPGSALAQQDGTAECDCSRKRGRCVAPTQVREQQVSPVSNGLSSLVVLRMTPPPGQCVEVTAYLNEQATIGGRQRNTGHPLYRVIDGPTDVEWRNVGTPATALHYSTAARAEQCFVCEPKKVAPEAEAARPRPSKGGGPYFHASLMRSAVRGTPPHLGIGLSDASPDAARELACNWPTTAGHVSWEACKAETLTESRAHPHSQPYTQKVLKCANGGFHAVAWSSDRFSVGVACGAPSRSRAEQAALEACREDSGSAGGSSECQVEFSALNNGRYATGDTHPGTRSTENSNGLWYHCWGEQRASRHAGMEGGCLETVKYCTANPDKCK